MIVKEKTATFVGHRDCYGLDEVRLRQEIRRLIELGVDTFLSGSMGRFDAICERTVHELKGEYPHIRLFLVIPYLSFHPKHNTPYDELIFPAELENVHYKGAIGKRNRYMIQRSGYAVCYIRYTWGGAEQTYRYAKKQSISIIDL